jgi:hypothetical protein
VSPEAPKDDDPKPGPGRRRTVERLALGASLGAAVFLGIGQLIEATGGS